MLPLHTIYVLITDILDPMFRFPGVCNIFSWFC